MEESASTVVITDPDGTVRYVNRGFEETTGYARKDVVGQNVRLLRSGRQDTVTYRDLWSTVLSGRTWRGVLHNRRKDGSLYWARATIDPIADHDGRLLYFVAVQEDVTGEVETRRALATRANHLEVLREIGHFALQGADLDEVFRLAADSVRRVLGRVRVEISLSRPSGQRRRFEAKPESDDPLPPAVEDDPAISLRTPIPGRSTPCGVLAVTVPDRSALTERDAWFLDHVATLLGAVIQRKEDEEQIRRLAQRDPLTGLCNRRVLSEKAEDLMAQARRGGFRIAVLFLDLDRFKEVNDMLGHAAGDELLARLGRRLERSLRRGETLARLGGDEFAVLLAPVRKDEPEKAARRILDRLAVPFRVRGRRVRVSASIGVALFPDDGETLDALLRHADTAMYRIKSLGGGDVASADRSDSTSRR